MNKTTKILIENTTRKLKDLIVLKGVEQVLLTCVHINQKACAKLFLGSIHIGGIRTEQTVQRLHYH